MAQPSSTAPIDAPSNPPTPYGQKSNPRLRKLAKKPLKPLKLAANAYHTVRSGLATPNSGHSTAGLEDELAGLNMSDGSSKVSRSVTSTSTSSNGTGTLEPHAALNEKKWLGRKRESMMLDPVLIAHAAKGPRKPLENEEPAAWLRVRVVSADGLVAKDRNGLSDP